MEPVAGANVVVEDVTTGSLESTQNDPFREYVNWPESILFLGNCSTSLKVTVAGDGDRLRSRGVCRNKIKQTAMFD